MSGVGEWVGAWIGNQRSRAATLSPERVEQLSAVGVAALREATAHDAWP
ncbi:helicase associated domain-containing protein [Streptomyces rochei]